jgi:hypothetical protein
VERDGAIIKVFRAKVERRMFFAMGLDRAETPALARRAAGGISILMVRSPLSPAWAAKGVSNHESPDATTSAAALGAATQWLIAAHVSR